MVKKPKTLTVNNDPALVDFLSENKVAFETLRILDTLGLQKTDGWVKIPDIMKELERTGGYGNLKNLRSTIHYYCKRLYEKYEAIDRYKSHSKSDRSAYYRITDKGKAHLSIILIGKKEKGERAGERQ